MTTMVGFMSPALRLGTATALVAATVALVAPAVHASSTPCRVTNLTTSVVGGDLQSAVDGAASGDTLKIAGVCRGHVDVTDKDLTLFGTGVRPTLDALGAGLPLLITGADVVLAGSLRVTGGTESGITNFQGTLTLSDQVRVTGNSSTGYGGGILNIGGAVVVTERARVTRNTAWRGGGIGSIGGSVSLAGVARVGWNTSSDEGGGIAVNGTGSVAVTRRSAVVGNTAGRNGGGVEVTEGEGLVSVTGRARVADNTAGNWGGGIFQTEGWTTRVTGYAEITGNSATHGVGGGLSSAQGTVLLSGSSRVSDNVALFGGGLGSVAGVARLTGHATVTANHASLTGGGIYSDGGILTGAVPGTGGNVFLNTPDDVLFQE